MKLNCTSEAIRRRAFTLVEMLVAMTLSIIIVLALYQVFDQIQKAFRANIAQVDVLEGGRATMDLVSTELSQLDATGLTNGVNFFALQNPVSYAMPALPGDQVPRTNVFREFFFFMRQNEAWQGVGYRVVGADNGYGELYRYSGDETRIRESELIDGDQTEAVVRAFNEATVTHTNMHRVIDGVVHFQIRAYSTNGVPYDVLNNNDMSADIVVQQDGDTGESLYRFQDEAIPASLEIELGILEPQVVEEINAFPNAAMRQEMLKKQAGKIHLFRQRIPIRTFSP